MKLEHPARPSFLIAYMQHILYMQFTVLEANLVNKHLTTSTRLCPSTWPASSAPPPSDFSHPQSQ